MEIVYLGHSAFKIKGKLATVVTDPYASAITGFKFPKTEADIVTLSHDHEDHNQKDLVEGNPFVIAGPGEYEVKGVSIFGVSSFHDSSQGSQRGKNTIYLIEMEKIRICHLGDLGHKLSDEELEELDGVDILMVPVGGVVTLGPAEAMEVINQLEPKIAIPMHFNVPGLNQAVFGKLFSLNDFWKEAGEQGETLPKVQVGFENLPEEKKIVTLETKNG